MCAYIVGCKFRPMLFNNFGGKGAYKQYTKTRHSHTQVLLFCSPICLLSSTELLPGSIWPVDLLSYSCLPFFFEEKQVGRAVSVTVNNVVRAHQKFHFILCRFLYPIDIFNTTKKFST